MKKLLTIVLTGALSTLASFAGEPSQEVVVTVKFKNASHAKHFMIWMSEQGEQDMYTWMEEAEPELAKTPVYDEKNRVIDYSQSGDKR